MDPQAIDAMIVSAANAFSDASFAKMKTLVGAQHVSTLKILKAQEKKVDDKLKKIQDEINLLKRSKDDGVSVASSDISRSTTAHMPQWKPRLGANQCGPRLSSTTKRRAGR